MTATATATQAACVGCDQPATRVVHYRVDRESRVRCGTFCDRCAEEVEALWPAQPNNVAPARQSGAGVGL